MKPRLICGLGSFAILSSLLAGLVLAQQTREDPLVTAIDSNGDGTFSTRMPWRTSPTFISPSATRL